MPSRVTTSAAIWLKALAISTLALFAPLKGMVIAAFAMVSVDLVTGLMRAHATKEKVQSSGLRRTVVKLVAYELSIVLAFVCEKWLTGDLLPLTKMAAGAVGLVELLSVLENVNILSGGALRPLLDKLAPAGEKGDKGARGPRGPRGPSGADGVPPPDSK
jgi:hypothetical protein